MLTVFVRSVLLYGASLLAMRALGKRQVGQLQPFEMVVVIMIAELAATPMGGVGIPLLYGILPMVALVVCLTLVCVVFIAKVVGCSLPILAEKLGLDPAVMASPFITTVVDALSLLQLSGNFIVSHLN